MGIFGEQGGGFGSLGAGAPDTGRGDAFDKLAASRGYGPLTPPGQPIPPGGFANVKLHGRRGVPIPSGGFVDVSALQGLGAVSRRRALETRGRMAKPTGTIRVTNPLGVEIRVYFMNNYGQAVGTSMGYRVPAHGTVTLSLPVGSVVVTYKPNVSQGTWVRSGSVASLTLMS